MVSNNDGLYVSKSCIEYVFSGHWVRSGDLIMVRGTEENSSIASAFSLSFATSQRKSSYPRFAGRGSVRQWCVHALLMTIQ